MSKATRRKATHNGSIVTPPDPEITNPNSPTQPAPAPKRIIISLKNSHSVWFAGPGDLQTIALFAVVCDMLEGKQTTWIRHQSVMVRTSEVAAVTLG